MTHGPEWFERIYDSLAYEDSLPFYKRWVFRWIISPIDDFYTWKYWKVDTKVDRFKNAIMRVKKGYDWSDQWNMNNWFIGKAEAMLEHWLEYGPTGSPMCEDMDGEEMTYETWVGYLREMHEGFKLWNTYEDSIRWPNEEPPKAAKVSKSHCPIEDQPEYSCWHNDAHYMTFDGKWRKCSMDKDERAKFERAMQLFCKYVEAMWD